MNNNRHRWNNETNFNLWETKKIDFTDVLFPLYARAFCLKRGSSVLETGCGTGILSRYIANNSSDIKIYASDISVPALQYCIKTADTALRYISLLAADSYYLPFRSNFFDLVISYTLLNVLSNPKAALMEMIRVCKQNGIVSAVAPVNDIPLPRSEQDFSWFKDEARFQELFKKQDKVRQEMFLKNNSINYHTIPDLFAKSGLKNVSVFPVSNCSSNCCKTASEQADKTINHLLQFKKIIAIRQNIDAYAAALSEEEFNELLTLTDKKIAAVSPDFFSSTLQWTVTMNMVISGQK